MEEKSYYKDNSEVTELCENDFNGNRIKHKDFKNKYGLVKAYAPWCGHCKALKEDMNFLADNLNKQGFQIGAINCVKNNSLSKILNVEYYPYLFEVYPSGELKPFRLDGQRNIENILKGICKFTNENNDNGGKCCRKENNKIICN